MGIFFVYILKSSVCLTIFYLFYKLLLSRDTFHRFNRIALLSLIMLSVIIPFCEIMASAYGDQDLSFGPEYIIPKPFDPRLIVKIAPQKKCSTADLKA